MELVVSNAERRAFLHGENLAVPRVGDIYAALPGITGKIELEYEGEMRGADTVIREIIRASRGQRLRPVLRRHQHAADRAVVQPWRHRAAQRRSALRRFARRSCSRFRGSSKNFRRCRSARSRQPEIAVSAAEFLLEGMYAHKRISRTEERSFSAAEKKQRGNDRPPITPKRCANARSNASLRKEPHPPRLQLVLSQQR